MWLCVLYVSKRSIEIFPVVPLENTLRLRYPKLLVAPFSIELMCILRSADITYHLNHIVHGHHVGDQAGRRGMCSIHP